MRPHPSRPAGALALLVVLLVLALTAVGGLGASAPLHAQTEAEEILRFDVTVELGDGNRMRVTEEITVRARGREIRRGIYRDFPTTFPRFAGLARIEAPFEVVEVLRDGEPEPYALERIGGLAGRGGMRVRIGDADVFLDDGVYRYTIRYETARWLAMGDDADVLYWNVTGNGWNFPILRASARVVPPRPVPGGTVAVEAWTGPEGSTASDATARWDPDAGLPAGPGPGAAAASAAPTGAPLGAALFETTARLGPREGLTVRVAFPKGVIAPPGERQTAAWFRLDWGPWIAAALLVLVVFAVYLAMWVRVGRDPRSGPVMVRYEPPSGYSPAALGYLSKQRWHRALLPASLVNLAVKGTLRIEQDDDEWTLRSTGRGAADLAPEERRLQQDLLGDTSTLTLGSSRSTTLRRALNRLQSRLKLQLEKDYFVRNRRWFFAGLGVSVLGLVILAILDPYGVPFPAWFLMFWLSLWTLGAGTLLIRALGAWGTALSGGGAGAWIGALVITLFGAPFWAAEVAVAGVLLTMVPRSMAAAAVLIGALNIAFYHLLERPTLKGRGVLDHLEGFRRFLSATDGDRLDRTMPPDRTPELFERYLPYAIALGVENRWAESFSDVLHPGDASPDGGAARGVGALAWYSGNGGGSGFSGVADSLGSSFSSSLSSASSPPPSSGGSSSGGGGGSSGGGGGGGGGGGW